MRRFGLCLDYNKNIWKSFYDALRQAKSNSGRLEEVYQIDLMPAEAIAPKLNPHMIVSHNENTSHLEDMFMSYDAARKIYEKNKLIPSFADIIPVWKIFKINKKNNKKEKVFEFKI